MTDQHHIPAVGRSLFVGMDESRYHTPADTPHNTTSPEALATVARAVGTAVENYLDQS
ncbi:hypothetical protein DFR75_107186 [Nocardia ignorata]|uniref:Uncharacterized protein n=1 Tax=Nocardia ignorata TaxID=145285 RepID=A0A4R6P348_NOCIG|nr:hypothetical protein DFR75_107186 [Nocardia ignorata]